MQSDNFRSKASIGSFNMVISEILCALVIILWISFLWSRRKYYAFARKMPGPSGLPLIGIMHRLLNTEDNLYDLAKIAAESKSKTCFFWFGPYPTIYTAEPEIIQVVLNSPDCINKAPGYDGFAEVVGYGLLLSKSPKWNKHRKLINPAFSHKILLDFIPIFNKHAHELCDQLDMHVGCGEVNVNDFVFTLTLKSSVASTMGVDLEEGFDVKFLQHFERVLEIAYYRAIRPWLRNVTLFSLTSKCKPFQESYTFISDFVHRLVMDKVKTHEKHRLNENNNKSNLTEESVDIGKTKHIFIDHAIKLLELKEFTFDDLVVESKIMVFAAYETTGTTLFSTFMCLAMHPQYQEKVFEEIMTVFPHKEFDVRYEDLKNLVYMDMCINETLRVLSTAPLIGRLCSKDVPLSNGLVIPRGTQILVDMLSLHRDEDIWGADAKAFNPDHFLPTNLIDHHKYSFIPFLKGPRNCIGWQYAGMIMKIALVQVLRKYRLSTKFRFEDLRFVDHLTLRYKELPLLEVQRR